MGNPITPEISSVLDAFLMRHIRGDGSGSGGGNYEVEAKFGTFVEVTGGVEKRICLPVQTSTILEPGAWFRFKSEIGLESHRLMNGLLNERCCTMPDWSYKRKRTLDFFYDLEGAQKTRLSVCMDKDNKEETIVEAIRKERIADLSIHCPSSPYDIRISINVERPFTIPETVTSRTEFECHFGGCRPYLTRKKDRLSYCWAKRLLLDLTQISQPYPGVASTTAKVHEFEIEVADIMREGREDGFSYNFIMNLLDFAKLFCV